MTDPKPLGDEETTDFERALLRSWKQESPSSSARARALAIAGLAAGGVAGGGVAAGTTAAPSPSAAPAPKAGAGKLLALAKWGLGAAIGVGLIGAGVALLRPSAPPSAAAPWSEPQATLTPPTAGEPPAATAPPVAPAPSGPATRAPLPLQASAPPIPAPAAASPPRPKSAAPRAGSAPGAPSDALGEQVAMIDRARDALTAGDAAGCLAALDAHDSKFPRSAMGEEATVLRIEALIRLGDRARAAELGQRFLASRPTSAHASGVRALLGAAEEP
ncbi:hypothetical protein predicted by Glimmer/Critica [Sorangium cellulosum So ce56]|uniref:Uncharacterized protein n=1 Tax=Sorangium cellulosum (strain So ce56) TaxID=448385 RepID=A9FYF0_SORC5|nr:hypothetical protein [Sorangium cellulosum]CAN95612.1 hypothetical protein predicted by Glimmer/Critica [Sorangium cellulosum So ce56]